MDNAVMVDPETPPQACFPNKGGQLLRLYRSKTAETQGQFGARYGLSANAISRYERGERWPDTPNVAAFQRDGVCSCEDWICDPIPEPDNADDSAAALDGRALEQQAA